MSGCTRSVIRSPERRFASSILRRDVPLAPGEIGEITIRGYVMPGYYKDRDRTTAAFDADGFFLTGDFGFIDDDGRLRFRGRIKEMVKTGGINVPPLEVEDVLTGHPAVEQAYVVGVPDPRKEEVLAAAVVLKDGAEASADTLRDFCQARLAAFKVPRHWKFFERDALPVTASGKVQKANLREMLVAEFERTGR